MVKIFLVEDELIMRNGIKENIDWEREGFEFAGDASDGELAYPHIKKIKPDILITDIKMPFMDGLELSRAVRKELPDTKIILLSGYDDFDYAKQAIGIGVTDYLLKPISSAKLLEAVHRVADIIEEERKKRELIEYYQRESVERIEMEKKRLFTRIINHLHSTSEILESGSQLGMELSAPCYNIILFKLLRMEEMKEGSRQYFDQLVKATDAVNAYIEKKAEIIAIERESEGWIFILKGENEEEIEGLQKVIEKAVEELIHTYKAVGYFGGIGKCVQRIGDLSSSYREAGKAFASRFFLHPNQMPDYQEIIHIREKQPDRLDLKMVDSTKLDRKLVNHFLVSGTEEEAEDFIEEYFRSLGEKQYQSQILRQYIAIDMYFCVVTFIEGKGRKAEDLQEAYRDAVQMSEKLMTVEGMKIHLRNLLKEAIRIRDQESACQYTILLTDAKKYIKENFQSRDISLNAVAAHVNISPSYFSTLFRQETGQTFIEYLTEIRMEKARELLMCSTMKTSEIGYETGYGDSHYFSYLFKKIQGCTPKEYRTRGKTK